MSDLLHRVNDALSGRPNTPLVEQFYHCVERYGFDSPSALGCLLALVREALGDPDLYPFLDTVDGPWCIEPPMGPGIEAQTEAEALVAALEAAPEQS